MQLTWHLQARFDHHPVELDGARAEFSHDLRRTFSPRTRVSIVFCVDYDACTYICGTRVFTTI